MLTRANASRLAALIMLLGAVAAAGHFLAGQRTTSAPALSGALASLNPMRGNFVPQPNVQLDLDGGSQYSWEAYWTNRLTYPTGRFDPSWLLNAEQQDSRIARAVPAGRVIYSHANNPSP